MPSIKEVLESGSIMVFNIHFEDGLCPMTSNNTGYKDMKRLYFMLYKYHILMELLEDGIDEIEPYEGDIKVVISYFGNKHLDVDNFQKIIFDAMSIKDEDCTTLLGDNVCIIKDDAQIKLFTSGIHIDKRYERSHIVFSIEKLEDFRVYAPEIVPRQRIMDEHIKEYIDICRQKTKYIKSVYQKRKHINHIRDLCEDLDHKREALLDRFI